MVVIKINNFSFVFIVNLECIQKLRFPSLQIFGSGEKCSWFLVFHGSKTCTPSSRLHFKICKIDVI